MADPGRLELVRDAFRPNRQTIRTKADNRVRNLDRERESADRQQDATVSRADALARNVNVTDQELVTAAEAAGGRAKATADAAFKAFGDTVEGQTKRLRELRTRGTSRDLEAALRGVDTVMESAWRKFREGLGSAEAIVREAKESLGTSAHQLQPERPKLHGPTADALLVERWNETARSAHTAQGRLQGTARDTLRAARSAQRRLGPSQHRNRTQK
ncbi:hypothetical protein DFP74_1817 [Nocardiopsis sp. Huas11]|uniref:hypothetical protein n=1 Tax=Nocardiopsis sp. Huas11 TaxID=2183912 RepID=UPI000EB3F0A1|nr:hypothetical protein [Nocardiopsis sp. Huas11]RKS06193.1 hypothetical protein DFP74_1817 [Nocardiopsis sp. Huas11]